MNRQDFNSSPDVRAFVDWAADLLPDLEVKLDISPKGTGRSSRGFGPGIQRSIKGFDKIVDAYHWEAEWQNSLGEKIFSGDLGSTQRSLNLLRDWIGAEVEKSSNAGVRAAAKAIIIWGGDRAHKKPIPQGAWPFLDAQQNLSSYLLEARKALSLDSADTNQTQAIGMMNAMLTKVHALLAVDGLPIYDSRVAGAIAALVELYRQKQKKAFSALPEELIFKATDWGNSGRRVTALEAFGATVLDPGVFDRQRREKCTREWTSAKVRLGWLIEQIISRSDQNRRNLLGNEVAPRQDIKDRMHAFEAGLFMIGFDIGCLKPSMLQ